MRHLRCVSAVLILLVSGWSLRAPATADSNLPAGRWTIATSASDQLVLTLGTHSPGHTWEWESSVGLAELQGLSSAALNAASNTVRFAVRKPAGTFDCRGWVARGKGGGTFIFVPDPSFGEALSARGIEKPDASQQFDLAVEDVTPPFIDQLHAAGMHPDLSDLLRLRNEGVDASYVLDIAKSGLPSLSIEDVIRLRNHDVRPDLLSAARSAGLLLTTEDVIELADHGVNAAYITEIHGLGFKPDTRQFVRLADHGVTAAWVRQVEAAGIRPSVEDLIRMRDAGV